MTTRIASTLLVLSSFSVLGCGFGNDRIAAPGAQESITASVGTADTLGEPNPFVRTVQCDGPEDELALLGSVCSATSDVYYGYLAPEGLGIELGADYSTGVPAPGPRLLIYGMVDSEFDSVTNLADEMDYAAFVLLDSSVVPEDGSALRAWREAEAVTEGSVVTEVADGDPCGIGWVGSGEFLWRSTTIRVSWSGGHGC